MESTEAHRPPSAAPNEKGTSAELAAPEASPLCARSLEETRAHAYQHMAEQAAQLGANAIVGVGYDAAEIMQGVTEVLCYGTAAVIRAAR